METILKIVNKTYPLPCTDIVELSHLLLYNLIEPGFTWSFRVDISGNVRRSSDRRIQKLRTKDGKVHTWNQYIHLLQSFFWCDFHYCINPDRFFDNLYCNYRFPQLHVQAIHMTTGGWTDMIYVRSMDQNPRKIVHPPRVIDGRKNHFYLKSFQDLGSLTGELNRLFLHRNEFPSIHFHMDGNGGGHNVPAQLITRCLVGPRESWMKPATKVLVNGDSLTWDVWREEDGHVNNKVVEELKLVAIPNYMTKYAGKVYVYMDKHNGSAAWYFITYLIYAFAKDVERFTIPSFGRRYKFGRVPSGQQITLKGTRSSTTSGDGNAVNVPFGDGMFADCPTEQFISCPIQPRDWNRFWMP
jgi:hypothetical protein